MPSSLVLTSAAHPSAAVRARRSFRRPWMTAYAFISPNLVLFSAFSFFPLLYAFYISFHDWSLIGDFIGKDKWQRWSVVQSLGDEAAAHLRRRQNTPAPSCPDSQGRLSVLDSSVKSAPSFLRNASTTSSFSSGSMLHVE